MPERMILTLNAGSSSLKASLYAAGGAALRLVGKADIDGVGTDPRLTTRDASGRALDRRDWTGESPTFAALLDQVLAWAEARLDGAALAGVGHRVVHGGREHVRPERVTASLLAALERLVPLAPLHEPHNIEPMRLLMAARPGLPQVACFDTAFHAGMPAVATRFALPRAYDEEGVRRYGFHGLSYEYVAARLAEVAPDIAAGRVVAAHLGAGASLCAMRGGRSVDTTMGFTALDGLVMGTRCGTLDAGVVLYMLRRGLSPDEAEAVLYRRSGLLGVSGLTGDMRALLASQDPKAEEAIALYVYRIVREVGALASVLGGLDGLVFTAGVGEHAAPIRERVCAGLAWLGVVLDPAANAAGAPVVSAPESRVAVTVMPTDEEITIAGHTARVLAAAP